MTTRDPRTPLKVFVSISHVRKGRPKDPRYCTMAHALRGKYGKLLLECRVLRSLTYLIFTGGREERYRTPPEMRKALDQFDTGYGWRLPPGQYVFLPVPPSWTQKARVETAIKRRKDGDPHMNKRYPKSKRTRSITVNPRVSTLQQLRGSAQSR